MLRLALLAATFLTQDPPPADPPCALFGRLVDAAGAPLAGVTLGLQGFEANPDRVRAFGLPTGWTNPAPVETDADGRFRVSFVPPRAYQFSLEATAPGRGALGWGWAEVEPGAELDLGTTTMDVEALLVGHIVDGAGQLLTEGWHVRADHNWNSGSGGRGSFGAVSTIDPDRGEFRITGLPPGRLRLQASAGSMRIRERWVETKAGEVTHVELVYDGPDPRRALVVSISTRPFYPFRPEPGTVHAIGEDGARLALSPERGRANDWHASPVTPGRYRVEIRDPRFLDWTQDEVATGVTARAQLEGSASLVVRVVDGASGVPVEDYALDIGYRNVNFSPSVFRVRESNAPLPRGSRYHGVVPGDLDLEVHAQHFPPVLLAVDALAPGETREVEVRLTPATTLGGRLVDHAGQPLAGIEVEVTRGAVPGHDDPAGGTRRASGSVFGRSVEVPVRYRAAATHTAADGTFQFTGLGNGRHTVYAPLGRFSEASAQIELPSDTLVELTAPEAIPVAVRLLLPAGAELADLALSPSFPLPGAFAHLRHVREAHKERRLWLADAEGYFPPEWLPRGRHPFSLMEPMQDGFGVGHQGVLRVELEVEREGELVLDLRARYPVRITLTPAVPEAPAAYVYWELQGVDTEETVGFGGFRPKDGPVPPLEGNAPPGTYTLRAVGPGFAWHAPEPVAVVRGATNELAATLPLIARNVQFVDGAGAPRARTHVAYWSTDGSRADTRTDERGACTLAFLPGEAFFALVPAPAPGEDPVRPSRPDGVPVVPRELIEGLAPAAQVTWASGSTPLTVRL